ncbi:MAG: aspartate kinase [Sphingobacteriia bacterium RIFOXYD2_FULL_35_12]|nr:aspartate kinase [Sediminibacterium sp.]OHC85707.1 MAG: aspartate kinase [Sphingobacteriia bacterium RIFOXYC2_FULL_35_18]OHC87243.1 MAG: aspartate kinase [Sphingobacteriia bacterium RIFOXYD2_FULL_35_12]OYY09788.1 MAG: aspartate kinase [Sphingobacteriia bacterium 35-36-14]OYZ54183.1 MAG: aspartate kinase [Sphingobacteriia bacterium 24-36-13]OZA64550.1 MAG: aspartate kinase [Sphingobacteriia bacterium 39-36-14]
MKVMKFGGTSVGKPERMHEVAKLITRNADSKIVVLSALSGTTNSLVEISNFLAHGNREGAKNTIEKLHQHYKAFIQALVQKEENRKNANQIIDEHFEFLNIILRISFSEALNKDILAQGELMSTKLFCVYLTEIGVDHELLPALEFMSIDANEEPQLGAIRIKLNDLIRKHADKKILVTQGYICRNVRGEVDNLKRGGSDYTASLIAAASNASVCEIWTDIDGMHNNDPRIVNKTVAIEQLSFDEAAELAYFGAKILHPTCIWPAQQENVPVKLLNTMQPDAPGTVITKEAGSVGVKAVAAKDGIIAIKIKSSRMLLAYGFLRKVFEVFEKYKTSIDMITTSEVAVSVTIDSDLFLEDIVRELEPFGTVDVDKGQTIVSIVGNEIAQTDHVLQKLFDALNEVPVTMVSYGGSAHNISLLVPQDYKTKTLQLLNAGLFGL